MLLCPMLILGLQDSSSGMDFLATLFLTIASGALYTSIPCTDLSNFEFEPLYLSSFHFFNLFSFFCPKLRNSLS